MPGSLFLVAGGEAVVEDGGAVVVVVLEGDGGQHGALVRGDQEKTSAGRVREGAVRRGGRRRIVRPTAYEGRRVEWKVALVRI